MERKPGVSLLKKFFMSARGVKTEDKTGRLVSVDNKLQPYFMSKIHLSTETSRPVFILCLNTYAEIKKILQRGEVLVFFYHDLRLEC